MRKKLLLLLVWLCGAGCYRTVDYQWSVKLFDYINRSFVTKVIWGNNEFVVANSERIYKSVDGKTWVDQLASAENIAWGNNQYVNVGGSIVVSADAVTWKTVLVSIPAQLNDVVWGGSGFMAVGKKGTVMLSPDGNTWSIASSGINEDLDFVKWAGNKYFIKGHKYINRSEIPILYYSMDGLSFVKLDFNDNPTVVYTDYTDITYGKSRYVLTGKPVTYYSDNGIKWAKIMPDFAMENVAWCDSSLQYVGVKNGGGWFDAPRIYTSTDGKMWYEHWNAKWGGDATKIFYADSIACHGESYVIGGRIPDTFAAGEHSGVMYSP